jgi:hypothetical protein
MRNKIKILILVLVMLFTITPVYAASSANKDLKELEVENHKIYFYKERTSYKLLLEEGENSLKINAVPDDEKAKVEITGADDLKENDYTVTIKVTAENGNTKEYTIKGEFKEVIEEEKEEGFFEMLETKLNEMHLKVEYFIFLALFIVGVAILNKVIASIRGRKIDKTMDKF